MAIVVYIHLTVHGAVLLKARMCTKDFLYIVNLPD